LGVPRERLLQLLLRFGGAVLCFAFPAVLLPVDWMASTHEALGLGPYPRSVIVEYLSRSIAALYGLHGILLLIVARDPERYREIVSYIAFFNITFGLLMLAIDLQAGMPWFWTIAEGPPIAAMGVVIAFVNRPIMQSLQSGVRS
jgi:hypothetical protein